LISAQREFCGRSREDNSISDERSVDDLPLLNGAGQRPHRTPVVRGTRPSNARRGGQVLGQRLHVDATRSGAIGVAVRAVPLESSLNSEAVRPSVTSVISGVPSNGGCAGLKSGAKRSSAGCSWKRT